MADKVKEHDATSSQESKQQEHTLTSELASRSVEAAESVQIASNINTKIEAQTGTKLRAQMGTKLGTQLEAKMWRQSDIDLQAQHQNQHLAQFTSETHGQAQGGYVPASSPMFNHFNGVFSQGTGSKGYLQGRPVFNQFNGMVLPAKAVNTKLENAKANFASDNENIGQQESHVAPDGRSNVGLPTSQSLPLSQGSSASQGSCAFQGASVFQGSSALQGSSSFQDFSLAPVQPQFPSQPYLPRTNYQSQSQIWSQPQSQLQFQNQACSQFPADNTLAYSQVPTQPENQIWNSTPSRAQVSAQAMAQAQFHTPAQAQFNPLAQPHAQTHIQSQAQACASAQFYPQASSHAYLQAQDQARAQIHAQPQTMSIAHAISQTIGQWQGVFSDDIHHLVQSQGQNQIQVQAQTLEQFHAQNHGQPWEIQAHAPFQPRINSLQRSNSARANVAYPPVGQGKGQSTAWGNLQSQAVKASVLSYPRIKSLSQAQIPSQASAQVLAKLSVQVSDQERANVLAWAYAQDKVPGQVPIQEPAQLQAYWSAQAQDDSQSLAREHEEALAYWDEVAQAENHSGYSFYGSGHDGAYGTYAFGDDAGGGYGATNLGGEFDDEAQGWEWQEQAALEQYERHYPDDVLEQIAVNANVQHIPDLIRAVLCSNGVFAQSCAHYKTRIGQVVMAQKIGEALQRAQVENNAQVELIEAGTGVGKTYAYLLPLILSKQKVLVSTYTKILQEQLVKHDLPQLLKVLHLENEISFSSCKGINNYLCHFRLDMLNPELLVKHYRAYWLDLLEKAQDEDAVKQVERIEKRLELVEEDAFTRHQKLVESMGEHAVVLGTMLKQIRRYLLAQPNLKLLSTQTANHLPLPLGEIDFVLDDCKDELKFRSEHVACYKRNLALIHRLFGCDSSYCHYCLHFRQSENYACFYYQAYENAVNSDIAVINHALLFSRIISPGSILQKLYDNKEPETAAQQAALAAEIPAFTAQNASADKKQLPTAKMPASTGEMQLPWAVSEVNAGNVDNGVKAGKAGNGVVQISDAGSQCIDLEADKALVQEGTLAYQINKTVPREMVSYALNPENEDGDKAHLAKQGQGQDLESLETLVPEPVQQVAKLASWFTPFPQLSSLSKLFQPKDVPAVNSKNDLIPLSGAASCTSTSFADSMEHLPYERKAQIVAAWDEADRGAGAETPVNRDAAVKNDNADNSDNSDKVKAEDDNADETKDDEELVDALLRERSAIVCDEAHELERCLIGIYQRELSSTMLNAFISDINHLHVRELNELVGDLRQLLQRFVQIFMVLPEQSYDFREFFYVLKHDLSFLQGFYEVRDLPMPQAKSPHNLHPKDYLKDTQGNLIPNHDFQTFLGELSEILRALASACFMLGSAKFRELAFTAKNLSEIMLELSMLNDDTRPIQWVVTVEVGFSQRDQDGLFDYQDGLLDDIAAFGLSRMELQERLGGVQKYFVLRMVPVSVGNIGYQAWSFLLKYQCMPVLTSATLRLVDRVGQNSFGAIKQRLGLKSLPVMQTVVPSPFDYVNHTRVWLSHYFQSSQNARSFQPEMPAIFTNLQRIKPLIDELPGGVLVLVTSFQMIEVYVRCLRQLCPQRQVFTQRRGGDLQDVVSSFKQVQAQGQPAILVGTSSCWTGLNLEGASVRMVVIDKAPFEPFDMRQEIMSDLYNQHNEWAFFQEVYLPNMLLKLKQGIGRLIRSEQDWGIIVPMFKLPASYADRVVRTFKPMTLLDTEQIDKLIEFIHRQKD